MSDTIEGSVDTKPLEQVSDETGEEEESPNEKEKTVVEEDTKESAEPVVTPPNDEEEENVVPANKEEDTVPVNKEEENVVPANKEEENVVPANKEEENVVPANKEEENVVPANKEEDVVPAEEPAASKRISVFQGHALHEYEWRPEGDIRGIVHICHGLHEYTGRYELFAQQLKDNGFLVRGIDLVGHGLSEGERGLVDSMESFVTDVVNHIKDTKKEFKDTPLFLFGHSNGGMVAIGVTLRIQEMFKGLIYSAPVIQIESTVIERFFAKIVGFIAPQTGLKPLDANGISSIPSEVESYVNDPLIYTGKPKAGFVSALLKAIDNYLPRLNVISLPLLVIHGTDDTLVPIAASAVVFDNVSSRDKAFERFEGSRHEILHDKDQERARALICQWLSDRLTGTVTDQSKNADSPQPLEPPVTDQDCNTPADDKES